MLAGLAACTTGTATTVTSTTVTGIVVRADTISAERGCGARPGQVYRYAAVVARQATPEVALGAEIYDCFADAAFVNLPPDQSERYDFVVRVFAFDEPGYSSQKAAIEGAPADLAGVLPALGALKSLGKADCQVSQVRTVQTVASCEALR